MNPGFFQDWGSAPNWGLYNNPLYSQWFVGYGTDTAFNANAETLLDNSRESTNPSTCIYDPYGVAVKIGNQGGSGPGASIGGNVQVIVDPNTQQTAITVPGSGILDGYGVSDGSQFMLGFAVLGGFLVMARKKWDLEPEAIKIGVLVVWIGLVWIGAWPVWSLIAAGVVGVMMFGKGVSKGLGG